MNSKQGGEAGLLPCPWCGDLPNEFEDGEIQCSNKKCAMRPHARWGGPEVWNTRVPAQPAPFDTCSLRRVRDVLLKEQQFAFVVVIDEALAALESRTAQPSPTTNTRQRAREIVRPYEGYLQHGSASRKSAIAAQNGLINRIASALQSTPEPVREIVQRWASSDSDAIDDLDALCRIAEVLDVEVKERNATPEPESY